MNKTLEQIIENFDQQHELYTRMHHLAEEQLLLLQQGMQSAYSDQINQLLLRRQDLLESIVKLNRQNKLWQEQVLIELDLPRFALSELKNRISEEQFHQLQKRVSDLGQLLESINNIDKKNQRAMEMTSNALSGRPVEKNSSHHAQKAYQKTMENQNKSS